MIIREERRWNRTKVLRHGTLIRIARERAGLTAGQVCRRADISKGQLSDIERGIGTLSLHRVPRLAAAVHGSVLEIIQAIFQDRIEEAGLEGIVVKVEYRQQQEAR